MGDKETE